VLVRKGLLFKKEVAVPADLIEKVENRKGSGEVVIETTPQEEEILAKRGLATLPNTEKKDVISQVQKIENAAHSPLPIFILDDNVGFFIIMHYKAWLERFVQCLLPLA
jgi:hypothetical protein